MISTPTNPKPKKKMTRSEFLRQNPMQLVRHFACGPNSPYSAHARLVMLFLAGAMAPDKSLNGRFTCFMRIRVIEEACGLGRTTVKKAIGEIRDGVTSGAVPLMLVQTPAPGRRLKTRGIRHKSSRFSLILTPPAYAAIRDQRLGRRSDSVGKGKSVDDPIALLSERLRKAALSVGVPIEQVTTTLAAFVAELNASPEREHWLDVYGTMHETTRRDFDRAPKWWNIASLRLVEPKPFLREPSPSITEPDPSVNGSPTSSSGSGRTASS